MFDVLLHYIGCTKEKFLRALRDSWITSIIRLLTCFKSQPLCRKTVIWSYLSFLPRNIQESKSLISFEQTKTRRIIQWFCGNLFSTQWRMQKSSSFIFSVFLILENFVSTYVQWGHKVPGHSTEALPKRGPLQPPAPATTINTTFLKSPILSLHLLRKWAPWVP